MARVKSPQQVKDEMEAAAHERALRTGIIRREPPKRPPGMSKAEWKEIKRAEAAAMRTGETVNEFAAQHGDYERNMTIVVNRGGTAIDRWKRESLLSDTQQAAILHMRRLWALAWSEARVVANLDRTVFGCPGDGDIRSIQAREDIKRIEGEFRGEARTYFDIFENVCRHDEPAGVAGSRLANDSRSATTAARLVVCMVADMIAMRERLSY